MEDNTRFVGLDEHAEWITVGIAEPGRDGKVWSRGSVPNTPESIRKVVEKLGPIKDLRFCYEAGPCGYGLYWFLTEMGAKCEVIAPTLIPVKSGDRVKTDRRDAMKLAQLHRSGELTSVWVPDKAHEALRNLVRSRGSAKKDQHCHRQQLGKFLLRHKLRRPKGMGAWSTRHMDWLRTLKLEHAADEAVFIDYLHEVEHCDGRLERLEKAIDQAIEAAPEKSRAVVSALQCLRGVAKITAVGVIAEIGEFSRFEHPTQTMGYSGLVPSEYSTGGPGKKRQGGITKTGNAHLRVLLVEAAWHYQYRPAVYAGLRKRQENQSQEIKEIAWKAQHRLNSRFRKLRASGKEAPKVIAAVARELLAFMWSIGVTVERTYAK